MVEIAAEQVKISSSLHALRAIKCISLLGSRHLERFCGKGIYDVIKVVLKAGCLKMLQMKQQALLLSVSS